MLWFIFLCAAVGLSRGDGSDQPALIADMDRDISAFYQRFRAAESLREKANAAIDLCQLHQQIWSDPRYASIEKLRGMRNRVVFQLKAAQKEIRKSLGEPRLSGKQRPDEVAREDEHRSDSFGDQQARTAELEDAMFQSLLLGLLFAPGPGQIAVHGGAFGGDDYGPELIALIESTIHPEQWDTNGGPGHIQYYRPVMALVVRASSVDHDDLTDLLQGIRNNGQ